MKFQITLKDPDGVYEGIREAARASLPLGLEPDELEELIDGRHKKLSAFSRPWIKYGEYVTIEFDTESNTAVVVKNP